VPYEGHYCRFGASIGIAIQHGAEVDGARLLIDADIALYRAKARGRNGFEFFSKALQAETVRTKRVADDILRAIDENEFTPHYQPMFDARTLELVGVEALARWQHPIDGALSPERFLKIAEDLNVVHAIDRIILEKSLADYRRWNAVGLGMPAISVNVSFRRLLDEQLIDQLEHLDIPAASSASSCSNRSSSTTSRKWSCGISTASASSASASASTISAPATPRSSAC
jgi:predicted signal transduction protein with EAL and GGDEF domain